MSDLDDKEQQAEAADEAVLRESRKHTRRSFAIAAVGAAAGWGLYEWIDSSQRLSMQPKPFRRAFQANARLSRAIFDDRALAPTYPLKRAEDLRVNGVYGLKQALVPESWRLQLTGVANARSYPQYVADVTAWEYRYADVKTQRRPGPRHQGGPQRRHGGEDGAGIRWWPWKKSARSAPGGCRAGWRKQAEADPRWTPAHPVCC